MGIVSENSNVYDDLTAWQNIMFSAELSHLPMVKEAHKAGDKFKLYTEDTSEVIDALWVMLKRISSKFVSIATLGPSLEDVFIRLTGLQRSEGIHAID